MVGFDPVVFAQDPLGLVPEIFNSVDVIAVLSKEFGVVDTTVMKGGDIPGVISLECVGIDKAVGLHLLFNDGHERLGADVRNDGRIHLAAPLQQPKYGDLATGPAAPLALADTPKRTVLRLHLATQAITRQLAGNQLAQAAGKSHLLS